MIDDDVWPPEVDSGASIFDGIPEQGFPTGVCCAYLAVCAGLGVSVVVLFHRITTSLRRLR